mmetsp:Transcript_34008/g.81620  ORF Transcript_34008/g.81620 Transcript_34008/m.81620 type:complete len:326 (-) Transcript_34008:245-1222(-)
MAHFVLADLELVYGPLDLFVTRVAIQPLTPPTLTHDAVDLLAVGFLAKLDGLCQGSSRLLHFVTCLLGCLRANDQLPDAGIASASSVARNRAEVALGGEEGIDFVQEMLDVRRSLWEAINPRARGKKGISAFPRQLLSLEIPPRFRAWLLQIAEVVVRLGVPEPVMRDDGQALRLRLRRLFCLIRLKLLLHSSFTLGRILRGFLESFCGLLLGLLLIEGIILRVEAASNLDTGQLLRAVVALWRTSEAVLLALVMLRALPALQLLVGLHRPHPGLKVFTFLHLRMLIWHLLVQRVPGIGSVPDAKALPGVFCTTRHGFASLEALR